MCLVKYTNENIPELEDQVRKSTDRTLYVPKSDNTILPDERKSQCFHKDRRKKRLFILEADGKRIHAKTKYLSSVENPGINDLYRETIDKRLIHVSSEYSELIWSNARAFRYTYNTLIDIKIHLPKAGQRKGSYASLCEAEFKRRWRGGECPDFMDKCEAKVVYAAMHEFRKALNEAQVLLTGRPSKVSQKSAASYIGSRIKYEGGKAHFPLTPKNVWFDYQTIEKTPHKIQEVTSTIIELNVNKTTGKLEVYACCKGIYKPRFGKFVRNNATVKELKYVPIGHEDCEYGEVPVPDKFTMERRRAQANKLDLDGIAEWYRTDKTSSDEGIVPVKRYDFIEGSFGLKWKYGYTWLDTGYKFEFKSLEPQKKVMRGVYREVLAMNHRQLGEYKQRYPQYFV